MPDDQKIEEKFSPSLSRNRALGTLTHMDTNEETLTSGTGNTTCTICDNPSRPDEWLCNECRDRLAEESP